MLPAINHQTNYIQFPNYHVGHHRLSADEAAEFNARFDMIATSGQFRNGEYSKALALKLISFTGYKYAIPTDSGTSALAIIASYVNRIRALNKVLVPSVTYQATHNALMQALPRTSQLNGYYNLSAETESNLQYWISDADAIVTVGLGGRHEPFDSPDTLVIEDCCQDWITKPHSGNHRAISFDPSKIVTGLSGGGAILTDSAALATYASEAIANAYQAIKSDSDKSTVFGKRTINEIDALHVLIMLESVSSRLQARRALMNYYQGVFKDSLLYTPGELHDMSKAILFIKSDQIAISELGRVNLVNEINDELAKENVGVIKRLYPEPLTNKLLISLPLSERFEVCPALEQMTSVIAERLTS